VRDTGIEPVDACGRRLEYRKTSAERTRGHISDSSATSALSDLYRAGQEFDSVLESWDSAAVDRAVVGRPT